LDFGGESLVLTMDTMAQGTHFRADADLADVAWKLVAANLSDLAAKGAEPLGVLLGYQLGEHDARFTEGLREVLDTYQVPLLGGDTVRTAGPCSFSLTAIGRASHTPVPDRRMARPGETVWVTGALGRAMLGYEGREDHLAAFNRPVPLIAEGITLAPVVSAMMDVSDGLLLDARRMAQASKTTLQLESASVPVAVDEARRDEALRWGDDYELLFTLPAGIVPPVAASRIGVVGPPGAEPLLLDGRPLVGKLGYEHG
jgi:thiamine-monophosphate kinase